MKCKFCNKKVFKRIEDESGNETMMRYCVNCGGVNIAGYKPNKGDKRNVERKNKNEI